MKVFEKLKNKIENILGYEVVDFKRTYASINMRASGAYVWEARLKESNIIVASCFTASELVCKNREIRSDLVYGIIEIT